MSKKRVLIIDDEEDLVEMLALRLDATGLFEVQTASDGEKGLARAAETKPDVVLLDSIMPGLDGWEVCRRIRGDSQLSSTAVVMMTAGTPEESARRARESAADGLILKPYDPVQVVDTLKAASHAPA